MKKILQVVLAFTFLNLSVIASSNIEETHSNGLTYALDSGRFGDQLVNYIKALWIAYKYDLTFFYRPFSFSDQLQLSQRHTHYFTDQMVSSFSKRYFIASNRAENLRLLHELKHPKNRNFNENNFYLISFFAELSEKSYINLDFCEDEEFRKILKTYISPLHNLTPLQLPENRITVAIHVRKGDGYWGDPDCVKSMCMPTKFPPDTFYLNGLKSIAEFFKGQPLYVHIFSDSSTTPAMMNKYSDELVRWGIDNDVVIGGRMVDNRFDQNVLEDFFAMMQFDCLIRPDSSYSQCAGLISGPIIEVTPIDWGVIRKDGEGKQIKDEEGNPVIDGLIKFRIQKGRSIYSSKITSIP